MYIIENANKFYNFLWRLKMYLLNVNIFKRWFMLMYFDFCNFILFSEELFMLALHQISAVRMQEMAKI